MHISPTVDIQPFIPQLSVNPVGGFRPGELVVA